MAVGKGGLYQGLVPVRAYACVCGKGINRIKRVIGICQVVHLNVLLGRSHGHNVGGYLDAAVAVVGHTDLTRCTLLGGDKDDAVCGTYAVDCGGRCILEHGEGLNIGGAQEVNVVHERAVNYVQGIGIVSD